MTLPTSRQRPWIFPGQREHMESRHHTVYEPMVHAPELMSSADGWHRSKQESERERVLASLRDNHTKDRYYVCNPNKNWGDNDLHKSRHRHKHPESLHGGVMTSKAGQQWGFNRLKERVNELNIRASAAFGTEANMAQPSKLPGKTEAEVAIDTALTMLYDAMEALEPSQLVQNAQKVLTSLYENGDTLGSGKIADYLQSVHDIKRDAVALLSAQNIQGDERSSTQMRKVVRALLPLLDRCIRLLDLVAKTANLSQPERKQAIQSSKGRDLAEARVRYESEPIYPGTGPGGYESTVDPRVPGSNPPGTTPFTASQQGFQGQRNLGEQAGPRGDRYRMLDFEPGGEASDAWGALSQPGSPTTSGSTASPTSSAMARGDRGPALMGLNAANAPGSVGRGAGAYDGDIAWLKENVADPQGLRKTVGNWIASKEIIKGTKKTSLGNLSLAKEAWSSMWAAKNKPELLTSGMEGTVDPNIIRKALEGNFRSDDKPPWDTPTGAKFWVENVKPDLIKKAGGCGDCEEGAGRRRHRKGRGIGDGPENSDGASLTFKEKMGRMPNSKEELMDFMSKMNAQSKQPVTEEGFGGDLEKLNPPITAEEKELFMKEAQRPPKDDSELYKWVVSYRSKKSGTGRSRSAERRDSDKKHARVLKGRGKPRDCEGSRLLKFLNDVEDSHHSSEGKKKNDSGRHK